MKNVHLSSRSVTHTTLYVHPNSQNKSKGTQHQHFLLRHSFARDQIIVWITIKHVVSKGKLDWPVAQPWTPEMRWEQREINWHQSGKAWWMGGGSKRLWVAKVWAVRSVDLASCGAMVIGGKERHLSIQSLRECISSRIPYSQNRMFHKLFRYAYLWMSEWMTRCMLISRYASRYICNIGERIWGDLN